LFCEQNILQRPSFYISYYFKKYRTEYYDRLQSVRDNGQWKNWLKFFLRGVYEVGQEATTTARKIVSLKEEHRQLVLSTMGRRSGNAIALLESLYFKPIFTVEHAEAITNLSYPNANNLIKDLGEIRDLAGTELIQEITGKKRNRAFSYKPYLDVFRDV
jgi:Fic family protein